MAEQPVRCVVIGNVSEFSLPICEGWERTLREPWLAASDAASDLGLFWGPAPRLVVVPQELDPHFLEDSWRPFGEDKVRVLSTESPGASLSTEILENDRIYGLLVDTLRVSEEPLLLSWGATPQLAAVVRCLRSDGVDFKVETSEPESVWVTGYVGSKVGFRSFATRSRRLFDALSPPTGMACTDLETAGYVAEGILAQGCGVAVKPDCGIGGQGTLLIEATKEAPMRVRGRLAVQARFTQNLRRGLVVVEELIQSLHGPKIAASVQGTIGSSGQTQVIGCAVQVTTSTGWYLGAITGRGSLGSAFRRRLSHVATVVGKELATLGFRGPFGVDAVATSEGSFRCVEINARRTFTSHLYEIGRISMGPRWPTGCTLVGSEQVSVPSLAGLGYADVCIALEPVHFPMAGERRGTLISIASSLTASRPLLGFVTIGRDAHDAVTLHGEAYARVGCSLPSEFHSSIGREAG